MLNVVNVVGSGQLDVELDIGRLDEDITNAETRYDPEKYHGMYLRFEEEGPLLVVYRSGKYIITGADSEQEVQESRERFLSLMGELGAIDTSEDISFKIQNYVCQGDLDQQTNLNALAIGLGLENTEYEPEQFPGLVYRPKAFNCVLLVFGSGKTIVTGADTVDEAQQAFNHLESAVADLLD